MEWSGDLGFRVMWESVGRGTCRGREGKAYGSKRYGVQKTQGDALYRGECNQTKENCNNCGRGRERVGMQQSHTSPAATATAAPNDLADMRAFVTVSDRRKDDRRCNGVLWDGCGRCSGSGSRGSKMRETSARHCNMRVTGVCVTQA